MTAILSRPQCVNKYTGAKWDINVSPILVIFGSDNGLAPVRRLYLNNADLFSTEHWVKFEWKCNWRKLIWKCRLQSGNHFSRPQSVIRCYNKMQDVLWCGCFCGYDALPTQWRTKHAWFLGYAKLIFAITQCRVPGVQYRISVRNPILVKSRLPTTYFLVTQLFWKFLQVTTVMVFEIISKRLYNSNWCFGQTRFRVIWV